MTPKMTRAGVLFALSLSVFLSSALQVRAEDVPAPGKSARIDAIKKAGALRVAVLANAPWLVENTTGSGEHWSGPAWDLSREWAKRLGVTLEPVLVSHETKVPVLAANQVDISVTPLAETAERAEEIDLPRSKAAHDRAQAELAKHGIGPDEWHLEQLALQRALVRMQAASRSGPSGGAADAH